MKLRLYVLEGPCQFSSMQNQQRRGIKRTLDDCERTQEIEFDSLESFPEYKSYLTSIKGWEKERIRNFQFV